MAWLESHQELGRHPKTFALASALHCSMPTAVGYLHCLWWWCLDFAPDGHIALRDASQVARAAFWKGNPIRFWQALVDAGFIDATDDGGLVHDWFDYAGKLIEQRELRRESNRQAQSARRQRLRQHAVTADVSKSQQSTGPDLTGPDRTVAADAAPARARGENGFQPLGRFVESARRQRQRQDVETLPDEVRERLARPPVGEAAPC